MKTRRYPVGPAGLISLLVLSQAEAEEKLKPGKNRIEVPAIGTGLRPHNLFQSGMIFQRDKPIRIWGRAEAGEKVTASSIKFNS